MLRRLRALPPVDLGLRMADAYGRYGVARSAAALSYFLVLTLFPLLMCANFLIGSLHLDLEQILAGLSQFLPTAALSTILDYLNYAAATQSSTLLLACLFTILMCASAGLRTLLQTMDDLFAAPCRDGFRRLLLSFILSALFLPTMYLSVVVVLTGDWFFHMLEELLPRQLLELDPPVPAVPPVALDPVSAAVLLRPAAGGGSVPPGHPKGAGVPPGAVGLFCRHRSGHGGQLGGVLLVHRHVLPIRPGIRLAGLSDHPAGVAVLLRQHFAVGGGAVLRVGAKKRKIKGGLLFFTGGHFIYAGLSFPGAAARSGCLPP